MLLPGFTFALDRCRAETIPGNLSRPIADSSRRGYSGHFSLARDRRDCNGALDLVKLDVHAQQIHVTRGLLSHVWEGYDAGSGVIDSREAFAGHARLLARYLSIHSRGAENLRDELICNLWQDSSAPVGSANVGREAFAGICLGSCITYQATVSEQGSPISAWENPFRWPA